MTPTRSPPLSIIINEVAWSGTQASSSDEWIELYNPGTTAVNMNGWVLRAVDGKPTIKLKGLLRANSFYVLERSGAIPDLKADRIQTFSEPIGDSNETLRLLDPYRQLIDTANSNGGNWPAGNSLNDQSMERRRPAVSDSDTAWFTSSDSTFWKRHDSAGNLIRGTPGYRNWAYGVTATPSRTPTPTRTLRPTATKTRPPTLAPQPLVGINEFVPRPGRDWNNNGKVDSEDEFIELINFGSIDVNLSGYSLDDEVNIGSKPFRLSSLVIKPGQRVVFFQKQTGIQLSDGGDGVRLLKPNGQLADAYNYSVVRFPDQSFCRLPDNGGLDDWNMFCYPTPGLPNTLSGGFVNPGNNANESTVCPMSDTAPLDFVLAECPPFGNNIFRPAYWDDPGWLDEKFLPENIGKWTVFGD